MGSLYTLAQKLPTINMKKLLFILLMFPVLAFGQYMKKEEKTTYKKVAVVDLKDLEICVNGLTELKRLLIYEPTTTSDQKVESFKNIESYIADLQKRIKIDSVKVEPKKP